MADFDSPWKEALDVYFRAFLAFFFPSINDDIDWSRGFESLDTELQQIAPRAAHGRRFVDKLVKVWRTNGREVWVLIHVEVQTQRDRAFSRRMYVYHYRIFDRYNRRVASLAVLADDNPTWRPGAYRDELWGCSIRLSFPAVKLLDYADRVAALEADSNPFAKVVLAHLKALETRRDPAGRRAWKFRLVRGLYEHDFPPEDLWQLWHLIDRLMRLPPPLEEALWQEVKEYAEVLGIKKGMLRGIESVLRIKFGEQGIGLLPLIAALDDADKFLAVHTAILRADRLEEIRRACTAVAAHGPAPLRRNSRSRPRTP
jgi:hypothetical protein